MKLRLDLKSFLDVQSQEIRILSFHLQKKNPVKNLFVDIQRNFLKLRAKSATKLAKLKLILIFIEDEVHFSHHEWKFFFGSFLAEKVE